MTERTEEVSLMTGRGNPKRQLQRGQIPNKTNWWIRCSIRMIGARPWPVPLLSAARTQHRSLAQAQVAEIITRDSERSLAMMDSTRRGALIPVSLPLAEITLRRRNLEKPDIIRYKPTIRMVGLAHRQVQDLVVHFPLATLLPGSFKISR